LKIYKSISELITSEIIELSCNFLLSEDTDFGDQVTFLDLDPKSDFKNADLTFVDFSYSDLRGFDFSGSNLYGATGFNVQWDHSTILKGAHITDSLFEYQVSKDKFFAENRHLQLQVKRLANQYWTHTILGVAALLKKGGSDAAPVARAVFDETKDVTVRSNILYFMRSAMEDAERHKVFLYNMIARRSGELEIVRAAVRALAALYNNDFGAINIMTRLLTHPEMSVRQEAFKGLLASKHLFSKHQINVFELVREHALASNDSVIRRMFVGRVAADSGINYVDAARAPDVANFFDFARKISNRDIFLAAERSLINRRATLAIASGALRTSVESVTQVKEQEIQARASFHKTLLEELRDRYRIPFVFDETPLRR
jgi:hypothetical protein